MRITRGDRLRAARKRRFKSARAAAIAFGLPISTYGAHERAQLSGGRDYGPEKAQHYARQLGVTPEWLLTGHQDGERTTFDATLATHIPIVGYVGAGAQVHRYEVNPKNLDKVDLSPFATPSTVAIEIRDASTSMPKNWLVLFEDERRAPTPDLIGRLCVIARDDGRVVIETVRNGHAGVLWAAPVKGMITR